jgi:hypothetical protein
MAVLWKSLDVHTTDPLGRPEQERGRDAIEASVDAYFQGPIGIFAHQASSGVAGEKWCTFMPARPAS